MIAMLTFLKKKHAQDSPGFFSMIIIPKNKPKNCSKLEGNVTLDTKQTEKVCKTQRLSWPRYFGVHWSHNFGGLDKPVACSKRGTLQQCRRPMQNADAQDPQTKGIKRVTKILDENWKAPKRYQKRSTGAKYTKTNQYRRNTIVYDGKSLLRGPRFVGKCSCLRPVTRFLQIRASSAFNQCTGQ